MNRQEGTYHSEHRTPVVPFLYPREHGDVENATERLQRLAGEYAFEIVRLHRPRVAMIKLAALQHLTAVEKAPVTKVAADLGISRQYFNQIKVAVGLSLRGLVCKR